MSFLRKIEAASDMPERVREAHDKITEFFNSFKKYGHELELLGSSNELMAIDEARAALKSMLKRAKQ